MSEAKVAIVTGAGSGIGLATALQCAAHGYDLALVGRTVAKLDAAAKLIADEYDGQRKTAVLSEDVSTEEGCQAIVDRTLEAFGRIDLLANVAGAAPLQPMKELTPEIWRNCVDTNLSATVWLTTRCWPTFEKQGFGFVANISSMAAFDPFPGFNAYAAAKAGVNMFTKVTADEGEPIGVNAVAIAPGAVETPMLRSLFNEKMIGKDQTLSPDAIAKKLIDCATGACEFKRGETIQMPN